MLKTFSIAIIAFAAATNALAGPKTGPEQIEAAERAFAADGLTMGMRDSFLKHMADDAIVFAPAPTNAKALYTSRSPEGQPTIEWWPVWVVAAKSGDLGLSTGPAVYNGKPGGWYASIWRKGADGQWHWIYDGGGAAEPTPVPAQPSPAAQAPVSKQGEATPEKAFELVKAAEASLAEAAGRDAPAAYRAVLAADARMMGPNGTRAHAPTAIETRLSMRPATMTLVVRGGGSSKAGDLVWTHGEAQWTNTAQKSVAGHYMHVWQRRPEGWRLIFETLLND